MTIKIIASDITLLFLLTLYPNIPGTTRNVTYVIGTLRMHQHTIEPPFNVPQFNVSICVPVPHKSLCNLSWQLFLEFYFTVCSVYCQFCILGRHTYLHLFCYKPVDNALQPFFVHLLSKSIHCHTSVHFIIICNMS